MRVDEITDLAGQRPMQLAAQFVQFGSGGVEGLVQALDLRCDLVVFEHAHVDREDAWLDQARAPEGHAPGSRRAGQQGSHGICILRAGFMAQAPSSNLRSKRSITALSAASSSSPSARTVRAVPMPAASIMTPMMLCAFTSRPLLRSQTVDLKPATSWTSLAEARACRPSRLDTTMSRSSMVDENPSATATGRDLGQFGQRFFRIIEYAQQHGQVEARDAAQVHAEFAQGQADVARRGAIEVGEHQHAVPVIKVAGMPRGERAHDVRVGAGRYLDGIDIQ